MAPRTGNRTRTKTKTTTKQTSPRPHLSLAKPSTVVDLRHPLPTRRRLFTGPMGVNEQAAIRAALAAAATRIPIPVRTWNGSTAQLADGTLLIHNPSPDRVFTAHIACPHGAIHNHPITTHTDLREARAITRACNRDHTPHADPTGLDWDTAITRGPHPTPLPNKPAVLQLREGIHRATAATAETQPLSLKDITDGVAARTPDAETPKEHPQP